MTSAWHSIFWKVADMERLSDWLMTGEGTLVTGTEGLAGILDTWFGDRNAWQEDGTTGLAGTLDLTPGWSGWDGWNKTEKTENLRVLLETVRDRVVLVPPGDELAGDLDNLWGGEVWREAGDQGLAVALDQLPGWEGWDGDTGLSLDMLRGWLTPLPEAWTGVPEGDDGDQVELATATGPRFSQIEPVPGDGYPGWWQGYDSQDAAWKYVQSGSVPPTDETPGWVAFPTARTVKPVGPRRFDPVEPVPGSDYPGWWQGYDSRDGVWKYVWSGDVRPTDETPGWTGDLRAAVLAEARTATGTGPGPGTGSDPAGDITTLVDEAAAGAIADVRELGVTEDELSDAEIIDMLAEDMATEMASE
jgi:hypothetical protein